MEGVKKRFGFGLMRLPMMEDKVNIEEVNKMVDYFLENGFNYFDTAHGYLKGLSEKAVKTCLTSRHERSSYILTNKLSGNFFKTKEDVKPLFESQLAACGVDYFDYYLMHAQNAEVFKHFKECQAYEQAFEFKKQGLVKHVGISFHDKASFLDQILNEYPQIEVVQIQFNYVDYDDLAVQSRLCYEVCVKHQKQVIVMEPIKGGHLVNLPKVAQDVFDNLNGGSNASYALRFVAGFENIKMILSGMSSFEQLVDNVNTMKDFKPLNEKEEKAIEEVCTILHSLNIIPCTACRYCEAGCPMKIAIPDLFALLNSKKIYNDWNADYYYGVHTTYGGKASSCLKCGKCERICPQHLKIRELLQQVATEFEKQA